MLLNSLRAKANIDNILWWIQHGREMWLGTAQNTDGLTTNTMSAEPAVSAYMEENDGKPAT